MLRYHVILHFQKFERFHLPRPHPHAGARNENGELRYIPDTSTEHLKQSSLLQAEYLKACEGYGEGSGGFQVLKKIDPLPRQLSPRILCLVYTHSGNIEILQAIIDTWAKDCDGFLAASNITIPNLGSVDLLHQGPDVYNNKWQKIRSIWAYAYDNYIDKFDYFHICADDTYVIVNNLRAYLSGSEIRKFLNGTKGKWENLTNWQGTTGEERPLLLGMPYDRRNNLIHFETYPADGCGYTLNQAALQLFVKKCLPNFLPDAIDSRETLFIGACFTNYNIHTIDTRDDKGAWRYLAMNAENIFNIKSRKTSLEYKYGMKSLPGLSGVSKYSVSINVGRALDNKNIDVPFLMLRYHVILHFEKFVQFHPPQPHPHAGARNGNGEWKYVPDTSTEVLKQSPLLESKYLNACQGGYSQGIGGFQILKKIEALPRQSTPRILCLVYTHSGNKDNVQAIIDTWAKDCDGFLAASNKTIPSLGSVDLSHQGPEGYFNMWQKIRSIWAYAYDNYIDKFDYFHICGDDTYVIVNNLRVYLGSTYIQKILNGTIEKWDLLPNWQGKPGEDRPLLLGMPHDRNNGHYYETFPGGGCGYTLNRAALQLFVEKCVPNYLPDAIDSREDVLVGGCFTRHNISTSDTRDNEGAWTYLANNAQDHFTFEEGGTWLSGNLFTLHGMESLPGLDGVSKHSVSIHLKGAFIYARPINVTKMMIRYHVVIHNLC